MSVAAMSAVFDADLRPPIKLVLLALADYADAYGQGCFPSVDSLSRRTGYTRRQIQRSLRAAIDLGTIVNVGVSPVGTTEYRILLPALAERPSVPQSRAKQCPKILRAEVIAAFGRVCQYCKQPGGISLGPDDTPWNIDRIIPGSRGGQYVPENITLACGSCNKRKQDREASALNLADVQGCQDDAPPGRQDEPSGVPNRTPEGRQIETQRGAKMTPEPTTKPTTQPKTPAPPTGAAAKNGTTWMTPFTDLHVELLGGKMQAPKWARAFKRLETDHGLAAVLDVQRHYLENLVTTGRQDFLDYNKMAESFGTWLAPQHKAGRPTRRIGGKDFDA